MSTQHMRVSNHATALRSLHQSHIQHRIRLENTKPSIDMRAPASSHYRHVRSGCNAKKQQIEADRNYEIQRENRILIGKMYSIMSAPPAYQTGTPPPAVPSLNIGVRQREYERVQRENQAIMDRSKRQAVELSLAV